MIHTEDKPPLTRRWTHAERRTCTACRQTSAHAEMDLQCTFARLGLLPNLRSRGDGPIPDDDRFAKRAKPPLTRRWTVSILADGSLRTQTSAHAEMDPVWPRRVQPCGANLRSRGDGPRGKRGAVNIHVKPPLTRRWTSTVSGQVMWEEQTSAHAEMDLSRILSPP